MGKLFEELEKRGCNIEEIKERFVDDEEFYEMCLEKLITDENFEKLGVTLKEKDTEAAFVCAHTLKGVISNMGIKDMYETIVEIVEPLRQRQIDGLYPKYETLLAQLEEVKALL